MGAVGVVMLGVLVAIVALVAFIATRPSSFRIARSARINAPPDVPFGLVNDFHKWTQWSPWEKVDPNLKRTFEGPAAGVGSIYSWSGNAKAGEGRMTIVEAKPGQRVEIKLQFIKPFAANNRSIFTFAPSSGGTDVSWAMEGERPFMHKALSLFMNMDKLVGTDFERGLAAMNTAAEAKATTRS